MYAPYLQPCVRLVKTLHIYILLYQYRAKYVLVFIDFDKFLLSIRFMEEMKKRKEKREMQKH